MIFFKSTEMIDNLIKFEALENEEAFGYCLLDLSGKNAVINELQFEKDKPYLAEGLLKAAFNFAATRNFYMGVCSCDNIIPLLTRLGFEKTNDGYILDIPSILMGSCCTKKEK